MKVKYKIALIVAVFLAACLFFSTDLAAQCPMCRMTAESNLRNGGTSGRGLNAGILYMLVVPYLLVGCLAYWWWKNRRNNEEELELPEE